MYKNTLRHCITSGSKILILPASMNFVDFSGVDAKKLINVDLEGVVSTGRFAGAVTMVWKQSKYSNISVSLNSQTLRKSYKFFCSLRFR